MPRTRTPTLPDSNFYQVKNDIFKYGLTPIQLSVYSYLVSCTGQKERCWPSMQTIANACGCSANAARAAVTELDRRLFIRKAATYRDDTNGKSRQTNNTYYILYLPKLSPRVQPTYQEGA